MMHSSYRRKFGPESVVELSKNITVQHEDYLKQDDPGKKADALRYMAGYVAQYLHLVPHDKKFTFKETERVLHNSAMKIDAFDPREASIAFTDLAKYAENLLEQPWRKEFHVIKLTSGFYYHNIEAQLQNAHEILIVLGYVNIDEYTLKLVPANMSFPILKAISRDCYVASQECLVLSQIWQRVADQEQMYPLTIGEVYEYRKNHLGDTETICNKLLYDIRARLHNAKQQSSYIPHQPQFQQQPHHYQTQPYHQQQRFVPVEKLIDYEDTSLPKPLSNLRDSPDHSSSYRYVPEREIAKASEHLKNVNLYDDSHIYDPVYDSVPNQKVNGSVRKSAPIPQQYPHSNGTTNNNTRKSNVYGYDYQQYPLEQQRLPRDSESPLIPKTVTNCFHNNVSKSNSMSSIHNNRNPQALTRSKVKETEIDTDVTSPREQQPPYQISNNIQRPRKSLPAISQQVYPDQFYPPIVRPTPVYGQTPQYYGASQQPQPPQQHHLLQYPTDIPYHHQSTPIPSDSEHNIHRASSSGSSSYTSVREADPSSRIRRSEPVKRPTHIDLHQRNLIPHADSSPDPQANLSSSDSGGSPRYPPSRGNELNSLDTVYYDYLLKQGQTDEFLQDMKNVNVSSQPESNHLYDGRRVVPKTHNADANEQSYNFLSASSEQQQKRIPEKHIRVSVHSTYLKEPQHRHDDETTEEPQTEPEKITPWDCRFCTFKNEREPRICEVCAKSKDFFEEEQTTQQPQASAHVAIPKVFSAPVESRPMEVDHSGEQEEEKRQCPQCTVFISPRARICDLCNYRLRPIESPRNVDSYDNR